MLTSHLAKKSSDSENKVEETIESSNLENLEKFLERFLFMFKEITSQKFIVQISLVFQIISKSIQWLFLIPVLI